MKKKVKTPDRQRIKNAPFSGGKCESKKSPSKRSPDIGEKTRTAPKTALLRTREMVIKLGEMKKPTRSARSRLKKIHGDLIKHTTK